MLTLLYGKNSDSLFAWFLLNQSTFEALLILFLCGSWYLASKSMVLVCF
jgi:hypothetical protein